MFHQRTRPQPEIHGRGSGHRSLTRLLAVLAVVVLGTVQGPIAQAATSADLLISVAGPSSGGWGSALSYTWTVTNHGPDAGDGATLNLAIAAGSLPAGSVSCAPAGGAVCPSFSNATATSLAATVATLPSGSSLSITATALLPATGSSVDITGHVSPAAGVTDTNLVTNSTTISTALGGSLHVVKTPSTTTPTLGVPFAWTMTVTNTGATDLSGVKLSDLYYGNNVNTAWTAPSCVASGGATCPTGFTAGSTTYNAWIFLDLPADLPAGAAVTINYQTTLTDPTPVCGRSYSVQNTGYAFVGGTNWQAVANAAPAAQPQCPQITILKTSSTATPDLGVPFTWTLTYTNNTGVDQANVKVSDLFYSNGLSATWTAASCSATGGAVCPTGFTAGSTTSSSWLFSDLVAPSIPIGGSLTVAYQMTVTDPSPACGKTYSLQNTGYATGGSLGLSQSSLTVAPAPQPACQLLTIVKTASTSTPLLGTNYTWTVVYTNGGPAAVNGTTLADLMYGNGVSSSWSAPTCAAAGGAVCPASGFSAGSTTYGAWVYEVVAPSIPVGGSITITYSVNHTDPSPACTHTYSVDNTGYAWGAGLGLSQSSVATSSPARYTDAVVQTSVNNSAGVSPNTPLTLTATVQSGCGTIASLPFEWELPPTAGFSVADPLASLTCTAPSGLTCPVFSFDPTTRKITATFTDVGASPFQVSLTGAAGLEGSGSHATHATVSDPNDLNPSTNSSTTTFAVFNTTVPLSVTYELAPGSLPAPVDLTISGVVHCTAQADIPWSITLPAAQNAVTQQVGSGWMGDVCSFVADPQPQAPAGYSWSGALGAQNTSQQALTGPRDAVYSTGLAAPGPQAGPANASTPVSTPVLLTPTVTPGLAALTTVAFDNGQPTKAVQGEGSWSISLVAGVVTAVFTPNTGYTGPVTPQAYTVIDSLNQRASSTLTVTISKPDSSSPSTATPNVDSSRISVITGVPDTPAPAWWLLVASLALAVGGTVLLRTSRPSRKS